MKQLWVWVAAGCVTQHVGVTPRELLHHVPELRQHGRATVATDDGGTYELDAGRVFQVTVDGKPRVLTVREMIANCPDVVPFANDRFRGDPPCLLIGTTVDQLPLDTRHHVDRDMIEVFLGAALVTTVIASVAAFVCHESSNGC
jgi:hypothetical protein